MTYSVDHYDDLTPIRADLARLWRDNLPFLTSADERIAWYYRNNPHGRGRAFALSSDTDAERIVGCAGVGARRMRTAGANLDVALLADFAVDRTHRTLAPALTLQRFVRAYCQQHYAVAYGFPNRHALPLFRRLGYVELELGRYVTVLRHAHYMGRLSEHDARFSFVSKSPALTNVAALGADAAAMLLRAAQALRTVSVHLEQVETFASDHDDLFERAAPRFGMIGLRDAQSLRWRFSGKDVSIWTLRERRSRELRAYAVADAIVDGAANVRDFLASDEDDLASLFVHLSSRLYFRGARSLSVRFLGSNKVVRAFSRAGLQPRNALSSIVVDPTAAPEPLASALSNVETWYITDGDEDA